MHTGSCKWTYMPLNTNSFSYFHIQWGAVITWSFFSQIFSQNTSHISPIRARYGMYFVDSNSDLYFASVTAVMFAISSYIGPCYNGTWLYTVKCHCPIWIQLHTALSVLPKVFWAPVLRTSGSWNLPVRMDGSLVRNFNNYYMYCWYMFWWL